MLKERKKEKLKENNYMIWFTKLIFSEADILV